MNDDQRGDRGETEVPDVFAEVLEGFGVWNGDYAWILERTVTERDLRAVRESSPKYDGVQDYADLRVWQLGIDLAEVIYRITAAFPQHERFGLASQLQRAAVSVPSNIAEGNARNSTADYLRFIAMARGSLSEAKTQLIIAARLGYIQQPSAQNTLAQVDLLMRQLTALYSAIGRSPRTRK